MKKLTITLLALTLQNVFAHAFDGCAEIDGINYYILTKGAYVEVRSKNPKYSGDVVIPGTIEYEGETFTVTAIGDNAFNYCTNLTSVSLPNTIKTIGKHAFEECKKLKTINIPQSIELMDINAFFKCEGLEVLKADNIESWCRMKINQDANPLVYAKHLYFGDDEVKELIIPKTVTAVCDRAFHGYKGLTSVFFENTITSIGDYAFFDCTELKQVRMSNSITAIGTCAFYQCTALSSLILSENLTDIKSRSFYKCESLSSVIIPNSVESIGDYAFSGCKSIKTIYIGNGAEKIGTWTFANCGNLTDIYCFAEISPKYNKSLYKAITDSPFLGSHIEFTSLHVPEKSINNYEENPIWQGFGSVVALTEEETGINLVHTNVKAKEISHYTLDGIKIESPNKGIRIVKMSDGILRKVFVK
ncbi:MAG: leucine-rich repeat domain-containing protein [Bacteroidaceae bacterium]|nr:leucine-rich repeat domain-containing protein [Bacteroidaceae bacterium]